MNDEELNFSERVGSDIFFKTSYNGEENRRAYNITPWKSDYEIYKQPDSDRPAPRKPEFLTFTANEDNSQIAMVYWTEYEVSQVDFNVEYRIGDGEWQTYVLQDSSETIEYIELDEGEYVQFRGENPNGFYIVRDDYEYGANFTMSGSFAASGDITSLLNGAGGDVALPESCFSSLFYECYGLTTAPALPSTTLAESCYSIMFQGCTGLTTAPELPATTLAVGCYANMFYGCTSLETAPALPAETLATSCYQHMFDGCTSLNSVTCLATDISAEYCTSEWLSGVGENGTFTKAASMSGWTTGVNGIPSGWTVEDN